MHLKYPEQSRLQGENIRYFMKSGTVYDLTKASYYTEGKSGSRWRKLRSTDAIVQLTDFDEVVFFSLIIWRYILTLKNCACYNRLSKHAAHSTDRLCVRLLFSPNRLIHTI